MSNCLKNDLVDELPKLRQFALSLTRDSHDADDLVQDSVERALSRAHQFQQNTKLEAWLMSIMYSVFINGKRREKVANEYTWQRRQSTDDFTRPSQFHHVDLIETLRAIRRLGRNDRMALRLLGLQQRSHNYASKALGTSKATSKTRLFRARARLKEILAA